MGDDEEEEMEDEDASSTDSETYNLKESLKPMNRDRLLNWGNRKSQYYEGDTADLEIGQEEDDALIEEEAGKEILRVRYEAMDDDDFLPSFNNQKSDKNDKVDDDEKDESESDTEEVIMSKKQSKTTKKLNIKKDHPEYIPILRHFLSNTINPLNDLTDLTKHLNENKDQIQSIGLTSKGKQYLQLKHIVLQTAALNLCGYLLLKQEECSSSGSIKDHPVMRRLDTLDQLVHHILPKEIEIPASLNTQYDHLIKAIRYMQQNHSSDNDDEEDDDEINNSSDDNDIGEQQGQLIPSEMNSSDDDDDGSDEDLYSSSDDDDDLGMQQQNEAKFSIRSTDYNTTTTKTSSKNNTLEFGDSITTKKSNVTTQNNNQEFSKMMNTVAQKTNQIKNNNNNKRKSKKDKLDIIHHNNDEYDNNNDNEEVNDEFMNGLKMMEDDLKQKGDTTMEEEDDDYYNEIKKQTIEKKKSKKEKYAVQPKYPKPQTLLQEGERAASRTILKNRGLVAHKNKLNRNPRVKKREQYRKALIRRRGAVRDVVDKDGLSYGGEKSGINRLVSRSRKLADGK